MNSLHHYSVGGATGDVKSTVETRGPAAAIALTTPGRNRVLYCPLAGRPGHNSSVADTVWRY